MELIDKFGPILIMLGGFVATVIAGFIGIFGVIIKLGILSHFLNIGNKLLIINKIIKTDKPRNVKILKLPRKINEFPTSVLIDPEDVDIVKSNRKYLRQALTEFGAKVKIINEDNGPRLTTYNLRMDRGEKPENILALENALKMRLRVSSIRIHAPIAGMNCVGIEVPNIVSRNVLIKEVITSNDFNNAEIPLALGLNIIGEPVIIDLAKLPHLLIAGTTGSGKSVCIHSLVISLLYKFNPKQLRLVMVDPKQVEFHAYRKLPHLLTPIVDDMNRVPNILQWLVSEMEHRYTLLKKSCVRNIDSYNIKNKKDLPYIVLIIDELADLMMTADRKSTEEYLCRLAQMARAVGIHVIIATQRPTVNIITGTIKANFPARIAFQVASVTDSRTILDAKGAEALLGCGDMLYSGPTDVDAIRIQGCFLSDNEIFEITNKL